MCQHLYHWVFSSETSSQFLHIYSSKLCFTKHTAAAWSIKLPIPNVRWPTFCSGLSATFSIYTSDIRRKVHQYSTLLFIVLWYEQYFMHTALKEPYCCSLPHWKAAVSLKFYLTNHDSHYHLVKKKVKQAMLIHRAKRKGKNNTINVEFWRTKYNAQ